MEIRCTTLTLFGTTTVLKIPLLQRDGQPLLAMLAKTDIASTSQWLCPKDIGQQIATVSCTHDLVTCLARRRKRRSRKHWRTSSARQRLSHGFTGCHGPRSGSLRWLLGTLRSFPGRLPSLCSNDQQGLQWQTRKSV